MTFTTENEEKTLSLVVFFFVCLLCLTAKQSPFPNTSINSFPASPVISSRPVQKLSAHCFKFFQSDFVVSG